jgi:hypothetical protein
MTGAVKPPNLGGVSSLPPWVGQVAAEALPAQSPRKWPLWPAAATGWFMLPLPPDERVWRCPRRLPQDYVSLPCLLYITTAALCAVL